MCDIYSFDVNDINLKVNYHGAEDPVASCYS